MNGRITNIQRFSVHDGPGIRTTVFLKGCSLRCRWCCNPEAMIAAPIVMFDSSRCIGCNACLSVCPENASGSNGHIIIDRDKCTGCGKCTEVCYAEAKYKKDMEVSPGELVRVIEKDKRFYERTNGGVTFSGGEAFLQIDFLRKTLALCKERGIHTCIETCGNVPWENIEMTANDIDLYLYDIKSINTKKHREYTGAGCERIMENCRKIKELGKKVVIRVPVIPEFNFDLQSIKDIISFSEEIGVEKIDFLPYHRYAENKYKHLGMLYWNPGMKRLDGSQIRELLEQISTNVELNLDG